MPEYIIQIPIAAMVYVTLVTDSEIDAIRKATSMSFDLVLNRDIVVADRKVQLVWDVKLGSARCVGKLYGKNAVRWPCKM